MHKSEVQNILNIKELAELNIKHTVYCKYNEDQIAHYLSSTYYFGFFFIVTILSGAHLGHKYT